MSARVVPRLARFMTLLACAIVTAHAAPSPPLDKIDPQAPCFRWPASDYDGDGVFDRLDRCGNTPRGAIVDEWGCPLDSDGDGVYDGLDRCPGTPAGQFVDEHGCSRSQGARTTPTSPPPPAPPPPAPKVSATERQLVEGGRIRLENVYFETASARLLPESEATLDELGEVLVKFPELRIEVQGHSDTRGSSGLNQRLSQLRAESVRNYLLSKYRLRDANITARGYGESQPETRERNDEERFRNRRVEIKALNPEVLPRNVKVQEQR